jgi:hypothetical protein
MNPSDLELYTTNELIDELLRRKTFLGVIIHAKEELKEERWRGEKVFQVHFNSNLDSQTACGILDAVTEYISDRDASS